MQHLRKGTYIKSVSTDWGGYCSNQPDTNPFGFANVPLFVPLTDAYDHSEASVASMPTVSLAHPMMAVPQPKSEPLATLTALMRTTTLPQTHPATATASITPRR